MVHLLGNGVDAFGFVRSFGIKGVWGLLSTLSVNFNWGFGIFFVCWWLIENVFELRFCCCFNGRIFSCKINPSYEQKIVFFWENQFLFTSLFHVAETLRIDGTRDLTSDGVFFNPVASSRDED